MLNPPSLSSGCVVMMMAKLEHNEVIVGRMSPMARFEAARDQAVRLTGRSYESISGDEALVERTIWPHGIYPN